LIAGVKVLRLKLKFGTFFFVCCWLPKYFENQVKMAEIISFGDFLLYLTSSHLHPEFRTAIFHGVDNTNTLLHSVGNNKILTY